MIGAAIDLGADSLTWHNLIFSTSGILDRQKEVDTALGADSSAWNGFLFESGIDPEELWGVICRLKRNRTALRRDVYPDFGRDDFLAYYRAPGSLTAGRRFRCLSPWLVAYVFPDGDVRPCLNSSYSFGKYPRTRIPVGNGTATKPGRSGNSCGTGGCSPYAKGARSFTGIKEDLWQVPDA
jgi:hypothetical protein